VLIAVDSRTTAIDRHMVGLKRLKFLELSTVRIRQVDGTRMHPGSLSGEE
jgi:hypothetical protein